jgi:SAM-dependent methyltransferase
VLIVPAPTSAFDGLAADYDAQFTAGAIGRRMRRAVWRRLDVRFLPGQRILEVNCGTGEDAVFLGRRGVRVLATDLSEAMVDLARKKVSEADLDDRVQVRQLALENLATLDAPPFDGALSNFGGLNCVANLVATAQGLASRLVPGAFAVLCVMGPVVPWEWFWYLCRGRPATAARRLRRGGVPWRGITVRYPSIGALNRAFAPGFSLRRVGALGAILPPPFAESWAQRHPRLLDFLDHWERRLEAVPPLPWIADHYLLELERSADV